MLKVFIDEISISACLNIPFLTSSTTCAVDLKVFAIKSPISIATVLGATSPGDAATSCKELKNLPITIPKLESVGSIISSSSFNLLRKELSASK